MVVFLPDIPRKELYEIEKLRYDGIFPNVIDNEFLDKYIDEMGADIRYISITKNFNRNLTYPYVEVYNSPNNIVKSILIIQPPENDFVVYEKVK